MGTFADATAIGADGSVTLDPQWAVGTKLHGGYLLALLGRAALTGPGGLTGSEPVSGPGTLTGPATLPHLTAISGTFLTAPNAGPDAAPARVTVEPLRAGRTTAQVRTQLWQGSTLCTEAMVTLGTLDDTDPWWSSIDPVDLPDETSCFRTPSQAPGGFHIPLMDVVEQHLHPEHIGFAFGSPARRGHIAGWQRLADGSDWDPLSLLVALDPVPPVSLDLGIPGWVPTIQLTAYIRRIPAPGPVRVRLSAGDITGERMDETAHVWDSKGRLVAQAIQYAAVRPPA